MLKDNFKWTIARVEKEYNPFEEHVRIHLDGVNHSRQFITSTNEIELRNEIEAYMNKDIRVMNDLYKTIANTTYGSRGQCKSLASKVNTICSPDDGGIAIGMVRKDADVELECHLEKFIDKVIFNDPATIVKWKDGTKTIVKTQDGETFDPMVGLAMCISKKAMGNQGNYFEVFKKYCEPWYEEHEDEVETFEISFDGHTFLEAVSKITKGFKQVNENE